MATTRSIVLTSSLLLLFAGTGATPSAARTAPPAGTPNPAWISDGTPRLYQRPVNSEAFAGCEWVRVRAATGARWRPLCS